MLLWRQSWHPARPLPRKNPLPQRKPLELPGRLPRKTPLPQKRPLEQPVPSKRPLPQKKPLERPNGQQSGCALGLVLQLFVEGGQQREIGAGHLCDEASFGPATGRFV